MPPWVCGAALAVVLALVYLLVRPPSADLAAATYRSELFGRVDFTIWDTGWYDGHSLPSYSLLSPELGYWLGLRELLALSAVLASAMFALIASKLFPRGAAYAATLSFAFGCCCELPSGRVPYDLGAALALASIAVLVTLRRGALRYPLCLLLALLSAVASPVAGSFLALAGLTWVLASLLPALPARVCVRAQAWAHMRGRARGGATETGAAVGLSLCLATLLPILALTIAFPEGGYEPFAAGALWPELIAALAFAALLPTSALRPRPATALRVGAVLYALALIASCLLETPMGSNSERLGELIGPPLVVGALWAVREQRVTLPRGRAARAQTLLLILAPLLLYWQLSTSIDDQVALAGDPTVNASYYAPLKAELRALANHSGPIRVEVPLTGAHWESAYLPGDGVSIARGWDRQLDTRYAAPFYRPNLTARAYKSWLDENAVAYVALPNARFDSAGQKEAELIERGLPYLKLVWRSAHWRLFAVRAPTPLAERPARLLSLTSDSFAVYVPHRGTYELRLRWTPYWTPLPTPAPLSTTPLSTGACVAKAPNGFTEVQASHAGVVRVGIAFSLSRVFSSSGTC